jgi:8-oxo-dGTP diphosphatase
VAGTSRQHDYVEPRLWYERLATCFAATGAYLTDGHGRLLLVKPSYRETWGVPGGVVEEGETPDECVQREVREEIGLDVPEFRLLAVDWFPPAGARHRPIAYFLFDGGVLQDPASIRLAPGELTAHRFVDPAESVPLVTDAMARCLTRAARARDGDGAVYTGGRGYGR